jgi:hypothetical protein
MINLLLLILISSDFKYIKVMQHSLNLNQYRIHRGIYLLFFFFIFLSFVDNSFAIENTAENLGGHVIAEHGNTIKDMIFKTLRPIAAAACILMGIFHTIRSQSLGAGLTYFMILIIILIAPSIYDKMFTATFIF